MRGTYDIIIAGCGVSGLYSALSADPALSVLILSKEQLDLSNSALAQGGVAAVLDRRHDDFDTHFHDTMVAGGRQNNPESVRVLVREGPENVLNLVKLGVDFDRDASGALDLTLEGGHTRRRIAHYKDTTGYEIVTKLIAQAKTKSNIDIVDNACLLRLEKEDRGFAAAILSADGFQTVSSRYFILATGGIGRIYEYTTNSKIATGDGIYFASRLGAAIQNLSLIQFHPTAFAGDTETGERFLISESVRGEGAMLLNCDGRRFMRDYDARGELAPRDVVSHFIMCEASKTKSRNFYLDITAENPEFVKKRFPAIYSKCLEYGIDMTRDRIPVFPCQHYLMGGIGVDTSARTAVEGLYAVGECSHTGVHGRNRLASNSLLEALVFPRRALNDIEGKSAGSRPHPGRWAPRGGRSVKPETKPLIRAIMQESFFVNPDYQKAAANLPKIRAMQDKLENGEYEESREALEAKAMASAAGTVLAEILQRKDRQKEDTRQ